MDEALVSQIDARHEVFTLRQRTAIAEAYAVGQAAQWADRVLNAEWDRLTVENEGTFDLHGQKGELVNGRRDQMALISASKKWTGYVALECAELIGEICNSALEPDKANSEGDTGRPPPVVRWAAFVFMLILFVAALATTAWQIASGPKEHFAAVAVAVLALAFLRPTLENLRWAINWMFLKPVRWIARTGERFFSGGLRGEQH